ncbi:MAG: hydrolase [Patescibacteria group bacterium]|nr:MAG: hydrolase [Patescibacteria group bacterium]
MKIINEVSSGGVVYKKENNKTLWLVIKHKNQGHWSFPKGHIADKNKNEDAVTAALREVEEEGGVKAKIIDTRPEVSEYQFKRDNSLVKKQVFYYLMEYILGDPNNHDNEIETAVFLPQKDVLNLLTYENDKIIFLKCLKKYQQLKNK